MTGKTKHQDQHAPKMCATRIDTDAVQDEITRALEAEMKARDVRFPVSATFEKNGAYTLAITRGKAADPVKFHDFVVDLAANAKGTFQLVGGKPEGESYTMTYKANSLPDLLGTLNATLGEAQRIDTKALLGKGM